VTEVDARRAKGHDGHTQTGTHNLANATTQAVCKMWGYVCMCMCM
jgi:hypothetical protein